jgi:hypothetical protein
MWKEEQKWYKLSLEELPDIANFHHSSSKVWGLNKWNRRFRVAPRKGATLDVCQCAGIRVHAIDWRDSRRGFPLPKGNRDADERRFVAVHVHLSVIAAATSIKAYILSFCHLQLLHLLSRSLLSTLH